MIQIKNKEQIKGIRKSCYLLVQLFEIIEKKVQPGVTTAYLDRCAREFIANNNAKPAFLGYNGFPAVLCTSINSEVIHGIPRERVLVEGDIVSIDCGIILEGYYSDCARTLPVGQVSDDVYTLLQITEESLYKGIDAAVSGNRISDISRAIYKHTKKEGYGVVREYSGHGVGLKLHEEPSIPNYPSVGPNPRLRPGFVIAIEPMINIGGDDVFLHDDQWTVKTSDGSISAHFEHTVVVYKDSTEILTLALS